MERSAEPPVARERWTLRRRRVQQLLDRYPFARDMLQLYGALLDVQEPAFLAALKAPPDPNDVAPYVAARVVTGVVDATARAGPAMLAERCAERVSAEEPAAFIRSWLAGKSQPAVDEYLARAAAGPVLEALGPGASLACSGARDGRDGVHCPRCGGRPQLSYLPDSGESLSTAPRRLLCCRCGDSWVHARLACPGCGERSTSKLPIYAESERFPHVRADGCETCRRYLLTLDLRKDPEAVPLVDELAALPLDLYLHERGFTKIAPNLMGTG